MELRAESEAPRRPRVMKQGAALRVLRNSENQAYLAVKGMLIDVLGEEM
jgi:hypothetical protein